MRLLLDTHILLWAAGEPQKLSEIGPHPFDDTREQFIFQFSQYLGDCH